ncbi:hypothetical protein ACO0R3_002585 [Hanseniaspora guilliermondii]
MSGFNTITNLHDLQFFSNLTSIISKTIYCFKSEQSMNHFKKHKGKDIIKSPDGLFDGLPLFSCELKRDGSYLLSSDSTNYTIYKYVIIPSDSKHPDKKLLEEKYLHNSKKYKLIDVNAQYNVSIYKYVYCEVINKLAYLSLTKRRKSLLKFEDDSLTMVFHTYHDYITITDNAMFEGNQWIFRENEGNVFVDDLYINDRYKLVNRDGHVAAAYDNSNRSNKWFPTTIREKLCDLKFPVMNNPPQYSTNPKIENYKNDYLSKFHENIVCMVFVLANYIRALEREKSN